MLKVDTLGQLNRTNPPYGHQKQGSKDSRNDKHMHAKLSPNATPKLEQSLKNLSYGKLDVEKYTENDKTGCQKTPSGDPFWDHVPPHLLPTEHLFTTWRSEPARG